MTVQDAGERILVGQDRTAGSGGWVQFTPDGNRFIVGVNPNDHPFNWSLAVITRENATALRDWLDQQLGTSRIGERDENL